MGTYRFEVQTGSDGSPELLNDRHEFECSTSLTAIREAQLLLARCGPGVVAKLFDPNGAMIGMDVVDE